MTLAAYVAAAEASAEDEAAEEAGAQAGGADAAVGGSSGRGRRGRKRAVLWVPGRNDTFYHPHVAELLHAHGWQLYVLSYRRMGHCRRLGLFDNPMHNSHSAGDFVEYHEDIRQAIKASGSDCVRLRLSASGCL